MIKNDIDILKKKIIYRFSYTGTLETDLLFNKYIIKNIHNLNHIELNLLNELANEESDNQIFLILLNQQKPTYKYKKLFNKLKDAE